MLLGYALGKTTRHPSMDQASILPPSGPPFVGAGNENVLYNPGFQTIEYGRPEFGALVFSPPISPGRLSVHPS